jgi:DNA-directed RNA polymerase subunit RPC12/RpoP
VSSRHEFDGQKVLGDHCNRCSKTVKWFHIPDSLASACKECGFVRIGSGRKNEDGVREYEAGPTVQEWLKDSYGDKKAGK